MLVGIRLIRVWRTNPTLPVAVVSALCLLAGSWTVSAETLTGRVVGITDGDTLTVLVERQQFNVRINAIDTPEKNQPFGKRSTQNIAEMAFSKDARLYRAAA